MYVCIYIYVPRENNYRQKSKKNANTKEEQ